ncbi:MAG: HD domain-containing phosphohydrolase [Myxococcota bacterium]
MSLVIPHTEIFDHTPQRPPLKVLVVDDDRDLRLMLRVLLERSGFTVVLAADRAEARDCLKADTYDAILVDLMLGRDSGLDVLWDAARIQNEASRLLISAAVDLHSVMTAVNGVGVYQVVEKPFSQEALLATLDRACSLTRVVRERDRLQRDLSERTAQLEQANARLQDAVTKRTAELLCGLLAALDYRDTETQAHSRRVAAYARCLGTRMGLEGEALADCTAGALLHDVGKIGVPDHILRKRGPLSPEEWAIMQRHPLMGDELLAPIAFLQHARRVVAQHHERWDGSGYPAGLRGEAIDLGARIFAVVDAHDAITSNRPHRKGRPISDARDLIALASGTQLDPGVVAAYASTSDEELLTLQAEHQDGSPFTGFGELLRDLRSA